MFVDVITFFCSFPEMTLFYLQVSWPLFQGNTKLFLICVAFITVSQTRTLLFETILSLENSETLWCRSSHVDRRHVTFRKQRAQNKTRITRLNAAVCGSWADGECVRAPELDAKLSKFSQISAPTPLPSGSIRAPSEWARLASLRHENTGQHLPSQLTMTCFVAKIPLFNEYFAYCMLLGTLVRNIFYFKYGFN